MAWVTLMYHRYLWLVEIHGVEDGNVLTRRCLGNTFVTLEMFYFFIWVVFIRVCSLCNNSLRCSVHYNLITNFTKLKKKKLKIEWEQRCKRSLAMANNLYQYFRSRKIGWKFMKEFRSSKGMLQNIYNRNWIYFKLYCAI